MGYKVTEEEVSYRRITRAEAIKFFEEADWSKVGSKPLQKAIQALTSYYDSRKNVSYMVVNDKTIVDIDKDIGAWHLLHMCQSDDPK